MSEIFEDAVRDWIAERRAVGRTIGTETARAYRADLALWQRYLEAQTGAPARVQDLTGPVIKAALAEMNNAGQGGLNDRRSEEHTSELQSRGHLVCRLLLEKKKQTTTVTHSRGTA